MNVTLSNIITFTVGAVIGSAVTWKIVKTKYDRLINEEIESVKKAFTLSDDEVDEREPESENGEVTGEESTYDQYKIFTSEYSEPTEDDSIHVISPHEFGELALEGYEEKTLTYYADGLLADIYGNLMNDTDRLIGKDFQDHIGDYEEDAVHIRNDRVKIDFEILQDTRTYTSVLEGRYGDLQREV